MAKRITFQFLAIIYIFKSIFQKMDQKKKFDDIRKPLEERGYEIVKLIGKGAFGEVIMVRENKSEKLFAVKTINKLQVKKKPFLQRYIDQQIEIMSKLNHPNIVRHESSFHTNDFIIIIMEYCDMGNLLTYQSKLPGKTFSLPHALQIIVEVMKGLKIIHQKNFIHRDIKSENILLKKVPKSNGFDIEYKIADFGFARPIGGIGAKTHCGTQKYMAPQILTNSYYGISVDLWALGVLFFFMLFAEYPFKSHEMKAEIMRRCNPSFSIQAVLQKKQKLKQITPDVEDFFKKLFVVDPKKRITFANIVQHPLFFEYNKQFQQSVIFYKQFEHNENYVKDDQPVNEEDDVDNHMAPEDESRSYLLKKKNISNENKAIQRQLQQISFEIKKIIYLKECAGELYDNYSSYLTYAQRLAARFYLLKAFLFYAEPLSQSLQAKKMPQCLNDADIDPAAWQKCTKTEEYRAFCNKLQQEQLKTQFLFEDTYASIQDISQHMPIKNFEKGYTLSINQKNFDELKFSYRSTTSHIFKSIHENKKIDLHLRNKIKMRLFCCHMINRIFNRKQIPNNFPHFINWLKHKKIHYSHTFDFVYFKKWILEETQDNLEKNISLLHKKFF